MNSEKVKEIKKDIEICMKSLTCENCSHHSYRSGECCRNLTNDILTYINDLESENERLENKNYQLEQDLGQCENGYKLELHTTRYQLHSANEDLKKAEKRIAELKEDKEKWQRKAINYYQMAKSYGVECIVDNDIDETLKEFIKE